MRGSRPERAGNSGAYGDGDRPGRLRLLRSVVVIPDSPIDTQPDPLTLPASEVSRLFEIARLEAAAIDRLDECLTTLRDVQRAKAALAGLSADEIRSGLEIRRRALDDPASVAAKAKGTAP